MNPPRIFLTGRPGVGKTTVVMRTLERLQGIPVRGFYTCEVRDSGRRIGFDAVGLSTGRRVPLARKGVESPYTVGRYAVMLEEFESLFIEELGSEGLEKTLVVVDEVGKMECYSPLFCRRIESILQRDVPVLGTVALRAGGLAKRIRESPHCTVLTVTTSNRDSLPDRIAAILRAFFERAED